MIIERVASRGIVFTFMDLSSEDFECPTNVYVINGDDHFFICDTFLGPDSMKPVIDYLEKEFEEKPIVIFNSHAHWDHYWGNCSFPNPLIISHEKTIQIMKEKGEEELNKYQKFQKGDIQLRFPTILFKEALSFPKEKIVFFYTPGHTIDSSSCFDFKDKILFAADNLESPIPYLSNDDLSPYLSSYKSYQDLPVEIYIPGHGPICNDDNLFQQNLEYLKAFPQLPTNFQSHQESREYAIIHLNNLMNIGTSLDHQEKKETALDYLELAISFVENSILDTTKYLPKIKEKIAEISGK
ncbi:MAG: MBL fold metallo-hydrolase [Candidatus Heimdallarchaeota archaeon]|nr:MBL fold metallo-hydrolase [Candidatus Heimdallarchaeota archaeon]